MTVYKNILRQITRAKDRVFTAQDLAAAVDDRELRRRLREAREWLEAADRRITELVQCQFK